MSNLLVVDWDYFFPTIERPEDGDDKFDWTLYDWGHKETLFHINDIWPIRAASFIRRDMDLPATSGEEKNFWDRFEFSDDAKVFVSESNALAASPRITDHLLEDDPIEEVWLYDAHHDSGYRDDIDVSAVLDEGRYSCEDWMILYWGLGANLTVRYPSWRHYAMEMEPEPAVEVERNVEGLHEVRPDVEFDAVMICRSGAWTPPWLDKALLKFIESCPVDVVIDLDEGQPHGLSVLSPRGFDLDVAYEMGQSESRVHMMQEARNDG